jgi:hypothetical protein
MTVARAGMALAAGLLLGALPFWRYAPLAASPAPHANHEPQHGGQLGMAGDHHLELVRGRGRVEAWVSDAWRRPVPASAGWAVFDASARVPLVWERDRLVGPDHAAAGAVEVVATLADGTRLAIVFDGQAGGRNR